MSAFKKAAALLLLAWSIPLGAAYASQDSADKMCAPETGNCEYGAFCDYPKNTIRGVVGKPCYDETGDVIAARGHCVAHLKCLATSCGEGECKKTDVKVDETSNAAGVPQLSGGTQQPSTPAVKNDTGAPTGSIVDQLFNPTPASEWKPLSPSGQNIDEFIKQAFPYEPGTQPTTGAGDGLMNPDSLTDTPVQLSGGTLDGTTPVSTTKGGGAPFDYPSTDTFPHSEQVKKVVASTYGWGNGSGDSPTQALAIGKQYTLDQNPWTFAEKTGKLGYDQKYLFTNPSTGDQVVLARLDRGPYVDGRDVDIGRAGAEAIRMGREVVSLQMQPVPADTPLGPVTQVPEAPEAVPLPTPRPVDWNSFATGWENTTAISAAQNQAATVDWNAVSAGWEGNAALSAAQNQFSANAWWNNVASGWEGNTAISTEQSYVADTLSQLPLPEPLPGRTTLAEEGYELTRQVRLAAEAEQSFWERSGLKQFVDGAQNAWQWIRENGGGWFPSEYGDTPEQIAKSEEAFRTYTSQQAESEAAETAFNAQPPNESFTTPPPVVSGGDEEVLKPWVQATYETPEASTADIPLPVARPAIDPLGLGNLDSCGGICEIGDRGGTVKSIQQFLNSQGADIAEDGIFGLETNTAVKNFQKENGLSTDGLVGPKTLTKMTELANQTLNGRNSFATGWENTTAISAAQNQAATVDWNAVSAGWEGNAALSAAQNQFSANAWWNNVASGWEGNTAISTEQSYVADTLSQLPLPEPLPGRTTLAEEGYELTRQVRLAAEAEQSFWERSGLKQFVDGAQNAWQWIRENGGGWFPSEYGDTPEQIAKSEEAFRTYTSQQAESEAAETAFNAQPPNESFTTPPPVVSGGEIRSGNNETVTESDFALFAAGWENSFALSAEQGRKLLDDGAFDDAAVGWEGNFAEAAKQNESGLLEKEKTPVAGAENAPGEGGEKPAEKVPQIKRDVKGAIDGIRPYVGTLAQATNPENETLSYEKQKAAALQLVRRLQASLPTLASAKQQALDAGDDVLAGAIDQKIQQFSEAIGALKGVPARVESALKTSTFGSFASDSFVGRLLAKNPEIIKARRNIPVLTQWAFR